jgi:hypothetical protein
MNLRARREEEGFEEREDRGGGWIVWPSLVRKAGILFCAMILFSYGLSILGLSLREGVTVAAISVAAVVIGMRVRRRKRRGHIP